MDGHLCLKFHSRKRNHMILKISCIHAMLGLLSRKTNLHSVHFFRKNRAESWMVITLLKFVPKNLVSYMVGALTRLRFPSWLAPLPCGLFVRMFNIDMSEAELPLRDFSSIEEVFTRKLKHTARDIKSPVCSPADGRVTGHGKFHIGEAMQVKGISYSLSELALGRVGNDSEESEAVANEGFYHTVYLAPHNYHRVHSPVSGELVSLRYIPGNLWPVNEQSVRTVPRLFARNERLTFQIATAHGIVFVVMVGAFNVGRIVASAKPEWCTNDMLRQIRPQYRHYRFDRPISLKAGDELGLFMLGSTVVSVFPAAFLQEYEFITLPGPQAIKMGDTIIKT